jgi:hypothetical protein
MRKALLACVIASAFAIAASTSRSDTTSPSSDTATPPEPVLGEPVIPNPGNEGVVRRFQPYDIGPVDQAAWPYASLSAAEKAVVDAGRSAPQWSGIHDGYKQAVLLRAAEAHAQAAAIQLGIDNLGTGVVP